MTFSPRFRDLVADPWGARFRGRRFACALGRGGVVGDKREGDGATPRGPLRLMGVGWRADRMAHPFAGRPAGAGAPLPTRRIGPADIWSDDPEDPAYNQGFAGWGHDYSHERLFRADPLYDLVVVTDHNWPVAEPGRGSAVFLHVHRKPRHPTEGCIAFARADLLWILRRWRPESRLFVRGGRARGAGPAPGGPGSGAGTRRDRPQP